MKYWLIGSGTERKRWSVWRKKCQIAIGFNIERDLSHFDEKQIRDYLETVSRASDPNVRACKDFVHNMEIGDIVAVREGEKDIVGICRITTPYKYDPEVPDYRSTRGVEWITTERQENLDDKKFPQKTLLDFTDQKQRPWLRKFVLEKIDHEQRIDWEISPPEKTEYIATRTNQVEGFVYVIGLGAYPGKYKIGHANDIETRVRGLGVSVPEPFTVLHYEHFNDSAQAEREIHEHLRQSRLRGEWFEHDLEKIRHCISKIKTNEAAQ